MFPNAAGSVVQGIDNSKVNQTRGFLVIADISGYTRFMAANAKVLAHAQLVITELTETILAGFQYPSAGTGPAGCNAAGACPGLQGDHRA